MDSVSTVRPCHDDCIGPVCASIRDLSFWHGYGFAHRITWLRELPGVFFSFQHRVFSWNTLCPTSVSGNGGQRFNAGSTLLWLSVGDLRFNKPVAPSCLGPGVNDATSYANACPQMPYNPPGQTFPSDHPGLCGAHPYVMEFLPQSIVSDSAEDCRWCKIKRALYITHILPSRSVYQCCEACRCFFGGWPPCRCGMTLRFR